MPKYKPRYGHQEYKYHIVCSDYRTGKEERVSKKVSRNYANTVNRCKSLCEETLSNYNEYRDTHKTPNWKMNTLSTGGYVLVYSQGDRKGEPIISFAVEDIYDS